jgi:hypothetical protein
MAVLPRINRKTSRDWAAIAVRVLDDAYDVGRGTGRVRARAPRVVQRRRVGPRRGVPRIPCSVDREEAAARDLQRLSELTEPCQERLARTQ